jgi:hypothetical protein
MLYQAHHTTHSVRISPGLLSSLEWGVVALTGAIAIACVVSVVSVLFFMNSSISVVCD